ncbi:hypothetical protein VB735_34320 [Halotia wernerae UHCC 0503]|nr:hypothetical protein [Halotia wernerae UHCC 0503]
MPKQQPKKPLPSQMIRVPTALIESMRELARLHRAGHTKAILQGLQELIASIDSTVDIANDTNINQLAQRISQLESQIVNSDITELKQQRQAMSDRLWCRVTTQNYRRGLKRLCVIHRTGQIT